MTGRVMIYVQHLLGLGHLYRAARIAAALAAEGLEVRLVSGGLRAPHLDIGGATLVQLSPARALNAAFSALADAQGRPVDDAWRARRRSELLAAFRAFDPAVLMVELFPFGRRQMGFELTPVLDLARARGVKVACSVRDIVQPKPHREAEIVDRIESHIDLVLVHGDPGLVRLEESFPAAARFAAKIRYTGYVGVRAPDPGSDRAGVVVSAGGGAVGARLLGLAAEAAGLSAGRGPPWRLVLGPNLPAGARAALADAPPPGVEPIPFQPDFAALLAGAELSISQAGYNSVMDVLAAGCRAVLVPYAGGGEMEQTMRAERLALRAGFRFVPEAALRPARLAALAAAALAGPAPDAAGLDLGGAETTARLVRDLLRSPGSSP